MSANGDAKTNGRKAMIEDQEDQDDILAGPDMPPEDAEEPDDAEGRFFGGGITSDTKDVLDFIDERDKNDLVCSLPTLYATDHTKKLICRNHKR